MELRIVCTNPFCYGKASYYLNPDELELLDKKWVCPACHGALAIRDMDSMWYVTSNHPLFDKVLEGMKEEQ